MLPRRYTFPATFALASAVDTSSYATFVFAILLDIWTAVTLWKKWYRETAVLCVAGLISVGLSEPYLHDLAGPGAGGPLFQFTVGQFSLAAPVPTGRALPNLRLIRVNGALLPLKYRAMQRTRLPRIPHCLYIRA